MIRLLSILVRLAGDILSNLNHIVQLLQESSLQRSLSEPNPLCEKNENFDSEPEEAVVAYTEEELVTISYAMVELRFSRWKIDKMRDSKELTTVYKDGNRNVRLIKAEVEAAKIWYARRKGRI